MRDGIVEKEHWRAFEHSWDIFLKEVLKDGTLDIGEHEGNVIDQSFGEDGGQIGARVVRTESGRIRGDGVDEDEDSANRVDVLLNKSYKTLFVGLVLLHIVGADQPRRVEDANLMKRSFLLISSKTQVLTNVPLTLVML